MADDTIDKELSQGGNIALILFGENSLTMKIE
jgi:hypothetical protein